MADRARAATSASSRDAGLAPHERPAPLCQGANVVATIPRAIDRWVLVGAHYDHLGSIAGTIYRGASDNAASVGVLAAFDRALAARRPDGRGVVLVAFDGEEMPYYASGALGSQQFARARTGHPRIGRGVTGRSERRPRRTAARRRRAACRGPCGRARRDCPAPGTPRSRTRCRRDTASCHRSASRPRRAREGARTGRGCSAGPPRSDRSRTAHRRASRGSAPLAPTGEWREARFTVERLEALDALGRHELARRGQVVTVVRGADRGPARVTVDDRAADESVRAALDAAVLASEGSPSDDEVFGTVQRQAVGASWPVHGELALRDLERRVGTPLTVTGRTRLDARTVLGARTASPCRRRWTASST